MLPEHLAIMLHGFAGSRISEAEHFYKAVPKLFGFFFL